MQVNQSPADALKQAVSLIGGQSAMARLCGKSQATVWKWVQSKGRLPAEYVLRIEAATGISRHDLRPDIYPVGAPQAAPAWNGLDRGESHNHFQKHHISQRDNDLGVSA